MPSNFYSKTISKEEEREEAIFILKHRLTLFPSNGQLFTLKTNDMERIVKVETLSCTCSGVETPHDHYYLRWKGIEEGDHVVIEQNLDTPRMYKMTID